MTGLLFLQSQGRDATLGPASNDRETVRALIEAGLDVARLNFSHGTQDDHRAVYTLIREEAEREFQRKLAEAKARGEVK